MTDELMHQGKTISQWEKEFNGEFTKDQLAKMVRGGCDLEKIRIMGLDESKKLDESFSDSIVTVEDFCNALKRNLANDNDKIMFRLVVDKHAYDVFDMHGKGGTFVVDLMPADANTKMNEASREDEDAALNESMPYDN